MTRGFVLRLIFWIVLSKKRRSNRLLRALINASLSFGFAYLFLSLSYQCTSFSYFTNCVFTVSTKSFKISKNSVFILTKAFFKLIDLFLGTVELNISMHVNYKFLFSECLSSWSRDGNMLMRFKIHLRPVLLRVCLSLRPILLRISLIAIQLNWITIHCH